MRLPKTRCGSGFSMDNTDTLHISTKSTTCKVSLLSSVLYAKCPHAKTRTATRFWRSHLLGISPGNASKFEQDKICSNLFCSNPNKLRSPKTCCGSGLSVGALCTMKCGWIGTLVNKNWITRRSTRILNCGFYNLVGMRLRRHLCCT